MALINFLEASVPLTKTFRMTKGGSVEKDHETHENTNKTMTDAPLMMEEREQRDAALLRQALEALEALKAENEMLREALKDAEVKQGEVK